MLLLVMKLPLVLKLLETVLRLVLMLRSTAAGNDATCGNATAGNEAVKSNC